MPDLPTFLTFYTAVLLMQLAPGPDMLLVMGRGIGQGRRVAVLTAAGTTLLAAFVQLPLLAMGVASLLQASPLAFEVLRWVGAAYLVWLGSAFGNRRTPSQRIGGCAFTCFGPKGATRGNNQQSDQS